MAAITLASYFIHVRDWGSTTDLPLQFGQGKSVYLSVSKTLESLTVCRKHPTDPHVIKVSKLKSDGTDVWGIIERGEYGFSATGVHSETFTPSYKRTVNDAELVPLYFRFHLPAKSSAGVMILQRLGVHAAYSDIRDPIVAQFRESYPLHRLVIGRFVPAKVLKELLIGQVRAISVTTRRMSSDIAETVRLKGAKTDVGTVEVRVSAPRGHPLLTTTPKWLSDLRKGKVDVVEAFGDEAEKVRIRVDYKGRTRWYDLTRPETIAPYLDVSAEVKRTNDGHPRFDDIDAYSQDLRDELVGQLGEDV